MREFCEKVLEFLKSEYNDSYEFKLELAVEKNDYSAQLLVKLNNYYTLRVADYWMRQLFLTYRTGEFIEERNQYMWQKELVDIIEGS